MSPRLVVPSLATHQLSGILKVLMPQALSPEILTRFVGRLGLEISMYSLEISMYSQG